MTRKHLEERPEPLLLDWQWVEKVLTLRTQGKTVDEIAKAMGVGRNMIYRAVRRIRWMSTAELGSGVVHGTSDRKIADEFIKVWDMTARRPGRRTAEYRPMSRKVAHEVSDAIRKVAHRATQGAIGRVAAGREG